MQKNAPFPPFSPPFDEVSGEGGHSVLGYPIPSAIVFFRFVPDSVSLDPIRFPFFRYRVAVAVTCSLGSHPPLGGLIPTCRATCGAMNSAISLSLFS